MVKSIIAAIGNFFSSAILFVVELLPDSPFTMLSNSPIADVIGYINWIVPFDFMLATGQTWLVAVGIYYLYSAILRWTKTIE